MVQIAPATACNWPEDIVTSGYLAGPFAGYIGLTEFRQRGPYDFQRVGAQAVFVREFTDYANLAIGLYASSAGISAYDVLKIADDYAAAHSRYKKGCRHGSYLASFAGIYSLDINLGYQLYQSGRIGNFPKGAGPFINGD